MVGDSVRRKVTRTDRLQARRAGVHVAQCSSSVRMARQWHREEAGGRATERTTVIAAQRHVPPRSHRNPPPVARPARLRQVPSEALREPPRIAASELAPPNPCVSASFRFFPP